jgi:hypothetical protein
MISFNALNRIIEDKCASDAEYRAEYERKGKVTLATGRALSD